mgnify:CR=1 FL=1|tara:strand:+ start:126141 stop:126347 length:207 start_codon:yes stop_codon:yes gene_type:complete
MRNPNLPPPKTRVIGQWPETLPEWFVSPIGRVKDSHEPLNNPTDNIDIEGSLMRRIRREKNKRLKAAT